MSKLSTWRADSWIDDPRRSVPASDMVKSRRGVTRYEAGEGRRSECPSTYS